MLMEKEVIAAVITSVATVAAAVISVANWRKRTQAEMRAVEANAALTKLESAIVIAGSLGAPGADAGYRMKKQCFSWTLHDDTTGSVVQESIELRAHQTFQNLSIPFRSSSLSGEGERECPIVRAIPPCSHRVRIGHVVVHDRKAILEGQVIVDGVIGPHSSPVSFAVEIALKGVFTMNRKAAETKYAHDEWKSEYVSKVVACPLDCLELTIAFPPSFHHRLAEPTPVAFLARTETVHTGETTRLLADATALQFDGKIAKLRVHNPVIGLKYALAWYPPD